MINLSEMQNKDYWLGQMVASLETARHFISRHYGEGHPMVITISNILKDYYREILPEDF